MFLVCFIDPKTPSNLDMMAPTWWFSSNCIKVGQGHLSLFRENMETLSSSRGIRWLLTALSTSEPGYHTHGKLRQSLLNPLHQTSDIPELRSQCLHYIATLIFFLTELKLYRKRFCYIEKDSPFQSYIKKDSPFSKKENWRHLL